MEIGNRLSRDKNCVRLASIGVGTIGQLHARLAAQMEECEYVAIPIIFE